jgi:hypothetical protein
MNMYVVGYFSPPSPQVAELLLSSCYCFHLSQRPAVCLLCLLGSLAQVNITQKKYRQFLVVLHFKVSVKL